MNHIERGGEYRAEPASHKGILLVRRRVLKHVAPLQTATDAMRRGDRAKLETEDAVTGPESSPPRFLARDKKLAGRGCLWLGLLTVFVSLMRFGLQKALTVTAHRRHTRHRREGPSDLLGSVTADSIRRVAASDVALLETRSKQKTPQFRSYRSWQGWLADRSRISSSVSVPRIMPLVRGGSLPLFVAVGAAKSGTTFLRSILNSHPMVRHGAIFRATFLPYRLPYSLVTPQLTSAAGNHDKCGGETHFFDKELCQKISSGLALATTTYARLHFHFPTYVGH